MLDKPNQTHAFVTALDEYGTGFAVRADNGEQIFIRSILAERSDIEVGDRIAVWYVPNRNQEHADRCPWFALHVKIEEEAAQVDLEDYIEAKTIEEEFMLGSLEPEVEPEQPKRDIYAEIREYMLQNGSATTSQISAALGIISPNLRSYLTSMNDRGEIARADIWTRGKQTRASVVVWAINMYDLLPEEIEL